jgi:glutaredoxin-dependent peroxiredoxin
MALQVGSSAPNFALFNSEKNKVTLGDYAGKNLLLLFFPAAFTGVCTTELCTTRDNIGMYNDLNTEIVAISVDMVFTLEKFKAEQNLNFPLLSDFNKEACSAYGCKYDEWILEMKGVCKRSAFVIDKSGIIQYAEVLDVPTELPNFSAIKAILDKLA